MPYLGEIFRPKFKPAYKVDKYFSMIASERPIDERKIILINS